MLIFSLQFVDSEGFIEVEFKTYTNKEHTDATGECCNNEVSACRVACDNLFNICIGSNNQVSITCEAGFYQTRIDYDDILFPENTIDSKLAKPIRFPFKRWQVTVFFCGKFLFFFGFRESPFALIRCPYTILSPSPFPSLSLSQSIAIGS